MKEDFKLSETSLLGGTLEQLRKSVAYQGHPLSIRKLTKRIGMSTNTYRNVISGDAIMQAITCEY